MAPGSGGRAQRLEPRGALLASLSEQGQIDWAAIARLSGCTEVQAQMELMAVGAVFRDPESGAGKLEKRTYRATSGPNCGRRKNRPGSTRFLKATLRL
ncbi:MAG: hypothetical protein HS126_37035 [Anaerolineales bacterium]|nr:hypothetical protein [Anaerolineales bacterium]